MEKPEVVILCGGKGSRLSEETTLKPKPMVEIGGRPILWHIMKIYTNFSQEIVVSYTRKDMVMRRELKDC